MRNKFRMFALLAAFAGSLLLGGCAKKHIATTTPPTPPPSAPTATLAANPPVIQQGQPAQLTWTTQNATEVTIDGIGKVSAFGSRAVTPNTSTTYTLTAKGAGGTTQASARVTVNPVAAATTPAVSIEELFKQSIKDVFFDYDKYSLRPDGQQALAADAKFLRQHPEIKVLIEGHCDERGSEEYNLALGDNRAGAARDALRQLAISPDRIRTVSYGKEKPFCTEATEPCYQQNRRGHLVLDR